MQQSKSKRWKLTPEQKALTKAGFKFYPPRKWKQGQKNTWLKKLRQIIGKSQVQFAAMLGEELKTIINIENGRTRLDGITLRVQAHAGWSICGDMKVPDGGIKSEHFKIL